MTILGLALGGALGALSRYAVSIWFAKSFGTSFPWGTLTVNATGCFLLGFFYALSITAELAPPVRLVVATGFLGAYTTFSTFSLETLVLLQQGDANKALAYAAGSVVLGLAAAWLGYSLASLR